MVDQCVERPNSSGTDDGLDGLDSLHGPARGLSVAVAPPREAVDRVRRLIEKALGVLGHVETADPLLVPASPALKGQLRREAADRGMSVTDWAVIKLESGRPPHGPASPRVDMPVVDRWRTRC